MSNKIIEKILEPSKIETSSSFLLKIKAIKYTTYEELKTKTYKQVKDCKYSELKGE